MDIGISGSSTSPFYSSQNPLKRARERVPKQSTVKSPKRRKQISERSFSEATIDNDDLYNSHLSEKTRDSVLKLKKISDPFSHDLQDVVEDLLDQLENNPNDGADLAESALVLSSVTHVYSAQVKSLHDEVLTIANRLSGKEIQTKVRQRKKTTEAENTETSNITDGLLPSSEGAIKENNDKQVESEPIIESREPSTSDNKNAETETGADVDRISTNNEEHSNGATETGVTPVDDPEKLIENGSIDINGNESYQESEKSIEEHGDAENQKEPSVEETKKLESEILNEIPGRCTRRQSERLKNILNLEKINEKEYKLKKRKFDDDPPDLISCIDEWNKILAYMQLNKDIDVDEILPPVLEIQVGRRRKKIAINNNEISADGDCETCHTANADIAVTDEKPDDGTVKTPLQLALPVDLGIKQYETLDHLSDDVQERFHALVQEMHKLPFDYGLMQQDMFEVYQQKFIQAVSLLSQNSVLVKRSANENTEKDLMSKVFELNDSQMSESDQTISSIAELLSQVRQQAAEEYHKGKQSKSDAEVPVSQMIATLKRIICSRYKKWHVRTDSDRAVFKRIKEFEDKVKAVLLREAAQGLFDVKKYEMEVMDVTMKESQDGENDDLFCPLSPILPLEGGESPTPEDSRNWSLSCSSRRSSIAGSVDGSSSWIRLFDIFSHMKKIDNSETCRHFYAVLALLSHKNLNVNYDTLFSQESAKLITKLLKSRNDNINKYPVGAKIMTSRCPDVDRDEVFLAPVINADTIRQVLEQDGYLSSSGYQSDGQGSSSTCGIGYNPAKSIQDAIQEFVIDPGEPLPEDFLCNRRRKKY